MLLRLLKLRPLQIFAYSSYPNYTKYMLITLYFSIKLRTAGHRLPGNAHTPRKLRCAAKILYEIMLTVFLCLTKPAFMRRPWRIKALPSRPWLGISVFHGIISTVSKPLRYSLTGSMCVARQAVTCGPYSLLKLRYFIVASVSGSQHTGCGLSASL